MLTRTRIALLILPALVLAAAVTPARPVDPEPVKGATGAVAIPKGVAALVSVNVAEIWKHPALLPIREARGKLEFAWAMQSMIGVTPTQIDRLTAFWRSSAPDAPHLLIQTRMPLDPAAIVTALSRPRAKEPKRASGKVQVAPGAEFAFILPVDQRTVLLAPGSADPAGLEKLADTLAPALARTAGDHSISLAVDVKEIAGVPLPFGGPLLQARSASLTVDMGEETAAVKLAASFPDAAKARDAEPILRAKLSELADWARAREKRAEEKIGAGNVYTAPLLEWMATTLKATKVRVDGNLLGATAEAKLEEVVSLVMLAVPDSALAPRGSSAADNNLKQLGLAIHAYHDVHGHCPGNSYDKDGKPLLSWRVQILPYLEQAAVYNRFKLDEPWDSPHNKPLGQLVIKVFQVPGRPAKQPWETYFRTMMGPKKVKPEYRPWLVEGDSQGPKLTDVTDGLSNTIMVVEAAEAVPWSKPDDLPYDGLKALPKLGGPNGTFAALFGDGSVHTYRRGQIDDANLRRMFQIADGEPVFIPSN